MSAHAGRAEVYDYNVFSATLSLTPSRWVFSRDPLLKLETNLSDSSFSLTLIQVVTTRNDGMGYAPLKHSSGRTSHPTPLLTPTVVYSAGKGGFLIFSVWAYSPVLIYFLEFQTFWFDVHIDTVFVALSTTLTMFLFCLTLNPRSCLTSSF